MTRAGLPRHLRVRAVCGPMVAALPPDAGALPSGCAQGHVFDGACPVGGIPAPIDRDFGTASWFDSPRAAEGSMGTPRCRTALQPDEPRFVWDASVLRCFAQEEVHAAAPPGPCTALGLRRSGTGVTALQAAGREARNTALRAPHVGVVQR